MDLIGSEKAGKILGYTSSNIRVLCSDEDTREKLGATKIGKHWILDKAKVLQYAAEMERKRKAKKKKKKKKKCEMLLN